MITYSWNGNTYSSSGTYNWIGTNSNGCDSTATLDLTINNTTSSTSTETSCDSYNWNGNTYSSSGHIAGLEQTLMDVTVLLL